MPNSDEKDESTHEVDKATTTRPILPTREVSVFPSASLAIRVGRPKSIQLMDRCIESNERIVILSQTDPNIDNPTESDLHTVGTLVEVVKIVKESADLYQVVIRGLERTKLDEVVSEEPYLEGAFLPFETEHGDSVKEQSLFQAIKEKSLDIAREATAMPQEILNQIEDIEDHEKMCDFIAGNLEDGQDDMSLQDVLEEANLEKRMEMVLKLLYQQIEIVRTSETIQNKMQEATEDNQREYYLRQQLQAIKEELGETGDDVGELEDRLRETDMPDEAREVCRKQINRLHVMQPSSTEYSVTHNFVEHLLDFPWYRSTIDQLDLDRAQEILDSDHYGLDKVKDRIVEYLAVRSLKESMRGPILCLVGPPGVGKTSLGKSVARALGRKFVRRSLGGVHDESEIRGHRRTYVGAMPGRIVEGMMKAGTNNPVMLLDEVDKLGKDFRGDPAAALLEVLDPEQNHSFSDHFMEVSIDLSEVLFIATANQLDPISPPLRDRMEIIEVPSYTPHDKRKIAKRHLLPRQIEEHGITDDHLELESDALDLVINRYTKEAGVRELERKMAELCRSVAVKIASEDEEDRDDTEIDVDEKWVREALGPEKFFDQVADRTKKPGVATGMAWTQTGGKILFVESSTMPGEKKLKLSGSLGDVMQESGHAALTYIRSHTEEFGLEDDFNEDLDLHVHVPAGAIPKDGPSAGVAMFTSILSAFTGKRVRSDLAMTGEITLRGNVLPVGGIREKVMAAHRAGIKTIAIPAKNEKDLAEIPDEVREEVEFVLLEEVEELPELALRDD